MGGIRLACVVLASPRQGCFESTDELSAVRIALLRALRESASEDAVQRLELPLRERRRLVTEVREEQRRFVVAIERRPPGDRRKRQAGESVSIGCGRCLATFDPLRREYATVPAGSVAGRAFPAAASIIAPFEQAEVAEIDVPVRATTTFSGLMSRCSNP